MINQNIRNPIDLKPYLRFKGANEMTALEAAKVICEFSQVYGQDVVYAVSGTPYNVDLNITLSLNSLTINVDVAKELVEIRSH